MTVMSKLSGLILLLACAMACAAQDRDNWQSLSQLRTTDTVRVSLTTRAPFTAQFQSWTPEQITVGTVSAKKEEVVKVERYRRGTWGRGKTAAVGALIGFGGGFAIGAAAGGCHQGSFGPCFSRGEVGAIIGVAGAAVGGLIGALLPHHDKEVIYAVKRAP